MMPTLQDGNKLVVNKIGYQIGELQRFDVIVFHANEKEDFVKRIIGLPGEACGGAFP
ncbi:Signal peptidase IB [Mycobacteroides abscessus subsp. abscessus]|nr:Signal peptidase IB [Mycobacteroides abscessus subsp. abscessus]